MVSPFRASCSVGANSNTHPFQEWHAAILATRIRAKKIRNFSSKHKWKDECKAKQKAPRFNMHIVKCHVIVRHAMNIKWTWTCIYCQKENRYNLSRGSSKKRQSRRTYKLPAQLLGPKGNGNWVGKQWAGMGEIFSVVHILILFEFQTMGLESNLIIWIFQKARIKK